MPNSALEDTHIQCLKCDDIQQQNTSCTSLCTEAMAEASQFYGQLVFRQDLVHVHGPQGHFCSASQAEKGVLHTIYLQEPTS